MFFKRVSPNPVLEDIIECFWIVENTDPVPVQQKIIPDGYTEVIFHFGDPYRIKLGMQWELQSKNLVAGQVRKHFLLENTGSASVLGIKFKPASLYQLYNLDMHRLCGRVVDIQILKQQDTLLNAVHSSNDHEERIHLLNDHFKNSDVIKHPRSMPVDKAIKLVFNKHGMVALAELCDAAGVGERQLENLFKKYVGLSPKFFSRIVRFNYIFQLVQENETNWTSLAYEAAYYDQSHFIRNFRSFTGERPSAYSFDEKNMANFFLKK